MWWNGWTEMGGIKPSNTGCLLCFHIGSHSLSSMLLLVRDETITTWSWDTGECTGNNEEPSSFNLVFTFKTEHTPQLWILQLVQGMATSARQVGDGDSWVCLHVPSVLSFSQHLSTFSLSFSLGYVVFSNTCEAFLPFFSMFSHIFPHFQAFPTMFLWFSSGFPWFSQVGAWRITCCASSPATSRWPPTRRPTTRRGQRRCSCGARHGGGGGDPAVIWWFFFEMTISPVGHHGIFISDCNSLIMIYIYIPFGFLT